MAGDVRGRPGIHRFHVSRRGQARARIKQAAALPDLVLDDVWAAGGALSDVQDFGRGTWSLRVVLALCSLSFVTGLTAGRHPRAAPMRVYKYFF